MEPITITLPSLNQIFSYFIPPESTNDTIIFPFKSSSKKFSRTVDSTKITQGKASLKDINDVLTVFELVYSQVTSTRRFLTGLVCSFFIPYLMFFGGLNWVDWRLMSALTLCYVILIFVVGTYWIYKRMCETGRRQDQIQKMAEMIRPAYAKRGLKWHFSQTFFCCWLELKKQESLINEQNSTVIVESHSDSTQENFIDQQGSHGSILEELKDGENIIICAGKNLSGPNSRTRIQLRYVICLVVFAYFGISAISSQYYYYTRSNRYYNNYYY